MSEAIENRQDYQGLSHNKRTTSVPDLKTYIRPITPTVAPNPDDEQKEAVTRPVLPILTPNPDWEEDLEHSTRMEDEDVARVLSYPIIKHKHPRKESKPKNCKCKEVIPNRGLAPMVRLSNGREMPAFGLGTWLGANKIGMIPVTDDSVFHAVCWAIDAGYRHFDTATIYDTERQVGWAINMKIEQRLIRREDVFVTTKLWNTRHERAAVVPALRASLLNLQLDYVDLYLIHWPVGQYDNGSFDETDYLDTWRGMQDARDRGLTRAIGVSNFNKNQLERLITLSNEKPAVLQIEVNLNLQQSELRACCCEHGVAVVAYAPFGSLFHARAAPDAPPPRTDTQPLLRIADKYHKTIPQVALRYLVELGVTPIPKSVKKHRVETNIEVFDFELTPEEKELLRGYDVGYRTLAPKFLMGSPHYPF